MGRAKRRRNTVNGELRPLAKAALKRALQFYDMSKEAVAAAGKRLQDLIAEARAEIAKADTPESGKKSRKKR